MNHADIEPNRALSRGFLNEAPFLISERHKAQGARHKVKEPEFRSQEQGESSLGRRAWSIGK